MILAVSKLHLIVHLVIFLNQNFVTTKILPAFGHLNCNKNVSIWFEKFRETFWRKLLVLLCTIFFFFWFSVFLSVFPIWVFGEGVLLQKGTVEGVQVSSDGMWEGTGGGGVTQSKLQVWGLFWIICCVLGQGTWEPDRGKLGHVSVSADGRGSEGGGSDKCTSGSFYWYFGTFGAFWTGLGKAIISAHRGEQWIVREDILSWLLNCADLCEH